MLSILAQPYPAYSVSRYGVLVCLLAGACVTLILFLLAPFGMHRLPAYSLLLNSLVYGGITFLLSVLFTVGLPALWPAPFAEERWTVGKEILYLFILVLFIAMGNLLADSWLSGEVINPGAFIKFMGITISVGIFPLTVTVLAKQHVLYTRYRRAAAQLNRQLHEEPPPQPAPAPAPGDANPVVWLMGDNQEEKLELPLHTLLLISTADNYINIFHNKGGALQTVLFRGTLKKMETLLQPHGSFLRCHRSHIVNMGQVSGVSGNAQGYKLQVNGLPHTVPVGRNYNEVVKARLAHLP